MIARIALVIAALGLCAGCATPDEPIGDLYVVVQETNVPCPMEGCIPCDEDNFYEFEDVDRTCSMLPARLGLCSPFPLCQEQIDEIRMMVENCDNPAAEFSVPIENSCM